MNTIQTISKTGLSMQQGKKAIAYGRIQWTEHSTQQFSLPIDEDTVAPIQAHIDGTLIDLDILAMVNANSRAYKDNMKDVYTSNRSAQFKSAHPVRWAIGQLVKKHLL